MLTVLLALAVSPQVQAQPSVYETLETHYNQNAFEACILMEKQVQAFTRNRLDTLAANSFFYLADAYNQLGKISNALSYFEQEKQIRFALGMAGTEDYSNTLYNLAYLYLTAGKYASAGIAAAELLQNDRKLFSATDAQYVESVLYVTDIYLQLDRLKDAGDLLVSSLRAQEKGSSLRGLLLNKLGDYYTYTGQYSRASRALTEAVDIHAAHAGEASAEYITAAINLGVLYMQQGKYPEAEEIFDVALTNLAPAEAAYASVLNNQALVLQSLGQLDRAENTLLQLKETDSVAVGTSHPDFAITLSNLGLVYADQGDFDAARRVLERALAIQKNNGEGKTLSFARKLNNLAKVHQMAGAPEKSVPLLEDALTIFRQAMGKGSPEYGTGSYNLGVAYWASGKGKTGYKYLRTSAAIRAKVLGKHHPQYAESLLKIAEYQWHMKSIKEARQSFGEVFENYYFQINETFPVLTEEEKTNFFYTRIRGAFDKFNSFAAANHQQQPELIGDAYNYLINTKAAIMFATEKLRRTIMASGDSALIGRFDQWQAGKEQIAKAYTHNRQGAELDSLLVQSDRLEKELARRSSAFQKHVTRQHNTWQEIRKTLKAGEAAVEVLRFKQYQPGDAGHFTGNVQYAFLVLTPHDDHPVVIPLENGNDLESKYLIYYRNNVKYKVSDAYSYAFYFKPLAKFLNEQRIHRIYFSPDGVFNQINLNSIENPESKKFIIDEFDIRFVTNTRELIAPASAGHNDTQPAMLMGYPKFNLDTTEIEQPYREKSITRGGDLQRTWRGGLLRYMRGDEGISMLPGTQAEVKKIAALSRGPSHTYLSAQASERTLKKASSPRILHIATHGYFLEDQTSDINRPGAYIPNPLLNAGLILAGAENFLKTGQPLNNAGDDGILTAYEAMNMNLDGTDLVVLSACETALGDVKNGEGVYGLQRAFKLAGARNIVMSLWNVDDEATQHLMTTFYEEMTKRGDTHQAFRAAQQRVKEKYPAPFYWGAFVMTGI